MGEKRGVGGVGKLEKKGKKGKKGENGQQGEQGVKGNAPVELKVRLFVGGLGPGVVESDLQQRFALLGTVHAIHLVEVRKGWDPEGAAQRGFAYVDFEATSEASLRKLSSAYNGCKWKGGVLRVETAKEHYSDRLRREWAEAEAEAAVKAKVAEKVAAAMAVAPARDMYSYSPDYEGEIQSLRSPKSRELGLEQGDEDEVAVDNDVVAALIEKERKGHLDLLGKLFPEDKDAGDNEEEVVEIVKLRAYPMSDSSAKRRKHALEDSPRSDLVAFSPAQLNKDESGVAKAPRSPGARDTNEKQRIKTRRVKFSEEVDAPDGEKVGVKKCAFDATKGVRPILKTTQEKSKKMNVAQDGNDEEEEADEEADEEEEQGYYLSSRSPSPEGGLSNESKWERLFKHAGLKQGPALSAPSSGVYSGIHLDDDDDNEPAAAVVETPQRDGMFSGVLSEEEDDETGSLQASALGSKATDSSVSKKRKKMTLVKTPQRDGVGSGDIFPGILSDPEEEEESQPHLNPLRSGVQESDVLRLEKKITEEPERSSGILSDEDEESADYEEDDDEGDEEEDEEDDEEDDEDEDMADFVGASSALQSLTPTPLSEADLARKWAKMFKSATSGADPVDGAFSGSLDEVDVPVRPRPAVKEQGMFESASAHQTRGVSEAPTASVKVVASAMDEEAIRQSSGEETAGTSSEDNVKIDNKRVTYASEDEEDSAGDKTQIGTVDSNNLLARFNLAQDEANPLTLEQTNRAHFLVASQQDEAGGIGVSNSTPQPEEQPAVYENTKWVQRASWKSLMGADGRATFSLKQVTKESETSKPITSETVAVSEQGFGAFSFNFARNAREGTTSRLNSINSKPAERVPKQVHLSSDSALDKSGKPDKVTDDEAGCSFMKSSDADEEWRASKNELRIDSKAKHKAAVRKMKKMKGSGGAR